MPKLLELRVPDLGGFEDVPIIEVLVVSGDSVDLDAPLVTLESDKATMEVPASAAGIIREVNVKIGDRVSPGSVLANLEVADDAGASPAPAVIGSGPESTAIGATDNGARQHPEPIASSESSTQELTVPDLGGFDNVPVISVFIKAGDTIAKDAALVELESDKATMEVPSLFGGIIVELRVNVGDKVSPGTVLATVKTPADASGSAALAPPSNGAASAPSESAAAPSTTKPSAPNTAQSKPSTAAAAGTSQTNGSEGAESAAPPAAHSQNGTSNGTSNGVASGPFHASPAIRRFARELGVTVGSVNGTGPNGRITRDDVQQYIKRALSNPPPATPAPSAPAAGTLTFLPWPKLDFERFGPVERRPLSRIAKLSGQNLARNWVMIPHVTQYEDADVTELEVFRKTVNAEHQDVKVTMLALLMKALVATLRAYPDFNSSLDGDELIIKQYYHLGFAADTPNGLVVPVIRDVDKKGILQIAADTSALAKKARDGKLAPADMSGSGFTISSLGGIGGTSFTPIINAPEVAILGVSRTITKPVWDGAAFAPRLILPLSLSYDHRVIDGAAAARFCTHLAGVMADIRKVLL